MKPKKLYGIGKVYSAVITRVKKDKILLDINQFSFQDSNAEPIVKKAAFFIKQKRFNPFIFFKKDSVIDVYVVRLLNRKKNAYFLDYEVVPCFLPIDIFIHEHPVGSMVQGKIEELTGATMTICLAPNVYAVTKRCNHAHTGQKVDCKIDRFHNQKISLRVF